MFQGENDIGEQDGFSEIDILKINLLYTYIVKKSKTYMPECQKLFAEVEDLDKMPDAQSIEDLKPVPKPNNYLGISDDGGKDDAENVDSEDKGDNDSTDSNIDEKESDENERKTTTRITPTTRRRRKPIRTEKNTNVNWKGKTQKVSMRNRLKRKKYIMFQIY